MVEPIKLADELHVRLRPDDLAFYGVSRAYVAEIVQTALLGEPVSEVLEGAAARSPPPSARWATGVAVEATASRWRTAPPSPLRPPHPRPPPPPACR